MPYADDDIGNNTCDSAYYDSSEQQRNNAVSIADQRPAGLHPARLGAIPVLRANVQPRRTPTAATTTVVVINNIEEKKKNNRNF